MKLAREPASSRPKPCAFLKKPHESCPLAALLVGPCRKKTDRDQISVFPSEISRFTPLILAHRGSALPWLVDDRAALRLLRRIWCPFVFFSLKMSLFPSILYHHHHCHFSFNTVIRPFFTRKFFQEILGLEGSKISWEKKNVSYKEIFRQNLLAQNFLRKFWLEFS